MGQDSADDFLHGNCLLCKSFLSMKKHAASSGVSGGSGFLYELLPAFGAGDGDFAFATGDTDGLAALGAGEIPVGAVLDPVHHQKELSVFIIALIGIAGEAAEQRHIQDHGIDQGQQQHRRLVLDEHGDDGQHQAEAQQSHIQTVVTIPARHKAADSICQIHAGLPQPAAYVFHWDHLV